MKPTTVLLEAYTKIKQKSDFSFLFPLFNAIIWNIIETYKQTVPQKSTAPSFLV